MDDEDEEAMLKQQCEDQPCSCIPPRVLYMIVPNTATWGCSHCPGAYPEGDYGIGGRDSHPDLIPETPLGYGQ